MVVLLEGPDGTGKTTLAEQFKTRDFEYWHFSRMEDVEATYKQIIKDLEIAKKEQRNIVIDRLFISNWVYQTVFKDGQIVSSETVKKVLSLIDSIIFCYPRNPKSVAEYLKRFKKLKTERAEDYSDMTEVLKLYNSYGDIFYRILDRNPSIKTSVYYYDMNNYKISELQSIVDTVIGYIRVRSALL